MGICYNCEKEISLKDEEVKCDSCGKIVNYCCHNCKKWFSIFHEDKKLDECKVCGFFVCPNCFTCGYDCQKYEWSHQIKNIILNDKISYQQKTKRIVDYIQEIKLNKDEKNCNLRGIPISYAKGRIKSSVVRMMGYRVKNEDDLLKFKQRLNNILSLPIGTILTVDGLRESGNYGQEYRDVLNYGVCLGKLERKISKKFINEKEIRYENYKRVENGKCPKLDQEKLIIKVCPNPKCRIKEFPLNQTECCDTLCIYKKGKNKGEFPKLKIKISNKDICQLNRGGFKKDGDGI